MQLSPKDWDYVDERADWFAGREWVFTQISRFLAGPPGTFLLRGDPGTGKTAVAARLAQASCGRAATHSAAAPPVAEGTISAAVFCQAGKATTGELIQRLSGQLDHSVAGFAAARRAAAVSQAGIGDITNVSVDVAGDIGPGAIVAGVYLPAGDDRRAFDADLAIPLRRLREQAAAAPVVLLVDAVDEAVAADQANTLSWKLGELDGVHLIVTCRPDPRVLADFQRASRTMDLLADSPSGQDDVRDYAGARLRGHGADGTVTILTDRIAREAAGNFLYAFHVTGTLVRSGALARLDENAAYKLSLPAGGLPGVYADFLARQIARDERRWKEELRPVLAGISVALGDGFTQAQLAAVASQLTGREFSQTKVVDVTREFGQFLDQTVRNGPFRVYHQSFARFLTDPEQNDLAINLGDTNQAVVRALVDDVPARQSQEGGWAALDPYLVAHLAAHAAVGGPAAWQDLADHPSILDRLDPASVAAAGLHALAAYRLPDEILGIIGTAHRLAAAPLGQRPGLRQLAMARHAGTVIHRSASPDPQALWSVRWAHLTPHPVHRTLRCEAGPGTGATVAAFADPDGRALLAVGDPDGLVRIWDPATDTPTGPPLDARADWNHPVVTRFPVVAFSDLNGRPLLATGRFDGMVRVWDPLTGSPVGHPLTGRTDGIRIDSITAMAVFPAPDGRPLLATASGDYGRTVHRVDVWDPLAEIGAGPPLTCSTHIDAIAAFSAPDGQPLLATGGAGGTVRIWDPLAGILIGSLTGHTDTVEAMAAFLAADGRPLLATGGAGGTVRIWDPLAGILIGSLTGHTDTVEAMAAFLAADGRPLLATGSADSTIRVWDPLAGIPEGPPLTGHGITVVSLAAFPAPDQRTLLASSSADGTVRIWDPASGSTAEQTGPSRTPVEQAMSVSWWAADQVRAVTAFPTRDGRTLVAAGTEGGVIRSWDSGNGAPVGQPWTNSWRVDGLAGFTTSKGRALLATATDDGEVWIVDPAAGIHMGKPLTGPDSAWTVVAFPAPDGRALLAVGYIDGATWVWDPADGTRVVRRLNSPNWVRALAAFTAPNGRILLAAASDDDTLRGRYDLTTTLRVWDPIKGRLMHPPLISPSWVWSLAAFTAPDGRIILAAGDNDATVHLWDPAEGTQMGQPLTGHTSRVDAVTVFSAPNGKPLLASGNWDHRIRIWDPIRLTHLAAIEIDSGVNALAPIGKDLIVGTNDGVAMITANLDARSSSRTLQPPAECRPCMAPGSPSRMSNRPAGGPGTA